MILTQDEINRDNLYRYFLSKANCDAIKGLSEYNTGPLMQV